MNRQSRGYDRILQRFDEELILLGDVGADCGHQSNHWFHKMRVTGVELHNSLFEA